LAGKTWVLVVYGISFICDIANSSNNMVLSVRMIVNNELELMWNGVGQNLQEHGVITVLTFDWKDQGKS